jgi:hypothetical protein
MASNTKARGIQVSGSKVSRDQENGKKQKKPWKQPKLPRTITDATIHTIQFIQFLLVVYRWPRGAYTHVSADQATISTGTSVSISHDQHISRFFLWHDENRYARTMVEIPTLYALCMSRIADCDIGVTHPFTFISATETNISGTRMHLDREQRMGLYIRGMIEDETEVQERVHQA